MSMYDYYSRPLRGSAAAIIWPLVLLGGIALLLVWRFWPHREADLDPQARPRPVVPRLSMRTTR